MTGNAEIFRTEDYQDSGNPFAFGCCHSVANIHKLQRTEGRGHALVADPEGEEQIVLCSCDGVKDSVRACLYNMKSYILCDGCPQVQALAEWCRDS
jgi:hypothetical protein